MDGKKIAFVVVLIVAIVAAFVILAKRTDLLGGAPQPPDRIMNAPLVLIDMKKPDEGVVTKTLREWQKLGQDSAGHYMNPKTKEYTMAYPMTCVSCQKQIPPPDYPAPAQTEDPNAREAKRLQMDKAYKCPFCTKSPFPPEQLNRDIPPPAK